MEEKLMLKLLSRFEWLLIRNRSFEAKRLVKQELNNIRGIMEKKCKKIRLRKDYCYMCKNYNCNKKVIKF